MSHTFNTPDSNNYTVACTMFLRRKLRGHCFLAVGDILWAYFTLHRSSLNLSPGDTQHFGGPRSNWMQLLLDALGCPAAEGFSLRIFFNRNRHWDVIQKQMLAGDVKSSF